jgi:hypothetical protein
MNGRRSSLARYLTFADLEADIVPVCDMCYFKITLDDVLGIATIPMVLTGGGGNEVAILEEDMIIQRRCFSDGTLNSRRSMA